MPNCSAGTMLLGQVDHPDLVLHLVDLAHDLFRDNGVMRYVVLSEVKLLLILLLLCPLPEANNFIFEHVVLMLV